MNKKIITLSIIIGVIVFLLICTAESLIALRKALDAAKQRADDEKEDLPASEKTLPLGNEFSDFRRNSLIPGQFLREDNVS